jgi:two-component system, LytTR family, response regulator
MLTVALIDDEPLALSRVKALLSELNDVRIVGEASSMSEARSMLLAERPDVAIVDIQLPDGSGFDLAESLPGDARPLLIFLTAFDQFAVRAFDVAAVDYVLKPVRPERLFAALDRAREMNRPVPSPAPPAQQQAETRPSRIAVTAEDETVILVPVKEIDYIEAAGNYVRLHTAGKHQLFRESITSLEEKLDPNHFARVHRSAIVNLDRVVRLEPNAFGDYRVILACGSVVAMSRRYRDRIPLLVGRL